jgi:hypothetical protein
VGNDVAIVLTSGRAIPAVCFPVRDAGRTIAFFTGHLSPVPP